MDYYIYVSGTKVNQLFVQIPKKEWPEIAGEVGINTTLFSAKVSSKFDPNKQKEDHDKLQAVVKYLNKKGSVGSIDSPNYWIQDSANVKIILMEEDNQVVFFSGKTSSGTSFALGGSAIHVVGQADSPNFRIGWSFLPFLLQSLRGFDRMLEREELNTSSLDRLLESQTEGYQHEWMDLIQTVQKHADAPLLDVEFLAKRLLSGTHPSTGEKGLLATPIYVRQLS